LIVIFFVSKGPPGLIDVAVAFRRRWLSFGIKFKGGVCGENVFENKIGLLAGELIGKIYRFGKRDIDGILRGKKLKEQFGVILEKGSLDILGSRRKGKSEKSKCRDDERSHARIISHSKIGVNGAKLSFS